MYYFCDGITNPLLLAAHHCEGVKQYLCICSQQIVALAKMYFSQIPEITLKKLEDQLKYVDYERDAKNVIDAILTVKGMTAK